MTIEKAWLQQSSCRQTVPLFP